MRHNKMCRGRILRIAMGITILVMLLLANGAGATVEKIVFASNRNGNSDIWMMDIDGTNLVQLTTNSSPDYNPDISTDGTKIVFISERTGKGQVWVMNSDGSNQHQLFNIDDLSIPYPLPYIDGVARWSPDGSYIISRIHLEGIRSSPWSAIYRHDSDGSNGRIFIDWGPSIKGKFEISPDGNKFAYTREDGNYWSPTLKISVGSIVGGVVDPSSLYDLGKTVDSYADEGVAWFPGNTKLIWSKSNNVNGYGDPHNLYSMNLNETGEVKLTNYADKIANNPDVSPDGSKVVFERNGSLYLMNADGTNVQTLLSDTYWNSYPSYGIISVNSIGYSATVATGQNTFVQTSNGSFGTILAGTSRIINNSVTLNNTGDVNATVDARFNDSRSGVYGLVSGSNVLNATNFDLKEASIGSWTALNETGANVRVATAPAFSAITVLDARLFVPPAQPSGSYSGTVVLTFGNEE